MERVSGSQKHPVSSALAWPQESGGPTFPTPRGLVHIIFGNDLFSLIFAQGLALVKKEETEPPSLQAESTDMHLTSATWGVH